VEIRIDEAYETGDFATLAYAFAPVGLVITENRVIRDCNDAFAEMFDYTRDELRNQVFAILYPSDEEFKNIRDRGVRQLRETNTYWDERIMAKKDGTLFWCRVRGQSTSPDNPFQKSVWSFADLSEDRPVVELTQREREVAILTCRGMTSKEIGLELDLSYRTVEEYRARLLRKFGARKLAELVAKLAGMPL
jgi:PAS domain S-box-containing protein